MRSARKVGGNAGKGRVKGVPNKTTADVRAMIIGALHDRGGQAWLAKQADQNPTAFMSLLKSVIPAVVQATVEQHTTITVQERRQKALELIEAAFGSRGRRDAHAGIENDASVH